MKIEDLIECDVTPRSENLCKGPNNCKNRKFDSSKNDCQDCLNVVKALIENTIDLPPEFSNVLVDDFWDLI